MPQAPEKREWELWNSPQIVDTLKKEWTERASAKERELFYGEIRALKSSGSTLLDFGCGIGHDAPEFVRQGWTYTGVDRTDAMLAVARRDHPELTFQKEDLFNAALPDNSFDFVVSNDVLVHLPDHIVPLQTLYRVARKYVVVKLCYLTEKRFGLFYPPHRIERDPQGFVLRYFNPRAFVREINQILHPISVRAVIQPRVNTTDGHHGVFVIRKE
ncbi:MAG TPA: class I SAM-dependent methyltransferase [Bdellovibrionota bacterium]|nr:class I SAM-dependent methyltransferase [Bdellovibrionota bacterium]